MRRVLSIMSVAAVSGGLCVVAAAVPGATAGGVGTSVRTSSHTVLDTRSGRGGVKGRLLPGHSIHLGLFGVAGIPASGAASVRLDVSVVDVSGRAGYASFYHEGQYDPHSRRLAFGTNGRARKTVTVPLGPNGRIVVTDDSSARFHIVVRVVGYTRDAAQTGWPRNDGHGGGGYADPANGDLNPRSILGLTRLRSGDVESGVLIASGDSLFTSYTNPDTRRSSLVVRSIRTGRVLWSVATDGQRPTGVVVHRGLAYVTTGGSDDGVVFAVGLQSHTVHWRVTLPRLVASSVPSARTITADAGQVYVVVAVTSRTDNLLAYDAATGALLWRHASGGPIVAADGTVYRVRAGAVYAGRTGKALRRSLPGGSALIGPYLVRAGDGGVSAVRLDRCDAPDSCRTAWSSPAPEQKSYESYQVYVNALPGGRIAVTMAADDHFDNPGSYVRIYDLATGRLLRDIPFANGSIRAQPVATKTLLLLDIDRKLTSITHTCTSKCWPPHTLATIPGDPDSRFDGLIVSGRSVVTSAGPRTVFSVRGGHHRFGASMHRRPIPVCICSGRCRRRPSAVQRPREVQTGQRVGNWRSNARLSSTTLTPGLPRKPRVRPEV